MNEHLGELWSMIYAELERDLTSKLSISQKAIELWFGKIELKYISDSNTIYFSIDAAIKRKFILDHKEYYDSFCSAIKTILGIEPKPVLICTETDSFENQFAEMIAQSSEDMKESLAVKKEEPKEQITTDEEINSMYSEFLRQYTPKEVKKSPPRTLNSAIHAGANAPLKYNPESGINEEFPLSDNISGEKDGMLFISHSVPACYPSYTFENFIVGNSNKLAYHYALQSSKYPGQQYSPLFIYGPPGIGKTHLLYAITNEVTNLYPNYNIIYVKGEDFINEFVDSIKKKIPLQFREKYRTADVLLVDDVQFIAGKESTQEEFFHTFNALYEMGKQIIMTADTPPKDIANLEERLRSRFESGPILKIDPPDIELRTAIIKKKFEVMNIEVPNDVIMFLSENITENVRQIEGIIKKMNAYCLMCNESISLSLAQKCISDIVTISEKIDGRRIVNAVSEKYGISVDQILGKKRVKEIVWARHMAVYLMRSLTPMSYKDIGKFFNRDHATIMSSEERIKKEIEINSEISKEVDDLIYIIKIKN